VDSTPQSQPQPGSAGGRAQAHGTAEQLRLFDAAPAVPSRYWVMLAGWGLVMAGEMSLARWQPTVIEALMSTATTSRPSPRANLQSSANDSHTEKLG